MTTRRRLLLAAAGYALSALPIAARAQAKKAPIVIGWLSTYAPDPSMRDLPVFKESLAALGRRDGVDVVIETRWAGSGNPDRLQQLSEELVSKKPAVIVTYNRSATIAAASAAPGVPIVQANGGSLVELGLAASYARPGGLVTGLTNLSIEISEKHTELLVDVMPKLHRIGYLYDATLVRTRSAIIESAKRAASRFKLQAVITEVAKAEELESAFAQFRKSNVQAIVVLPSSWFFPERLRISQLALREQLPLVAGQSEIAEAGALISYGAERSSGFSRAAWYVDQILKGVRPGNLPIEQSSKFELVVNLKTARALGITVPPVVMVRADRVIE